LLLLWACSLVCHGRRRRFAHYDCRGAVCASRRSAGSLLGASQLSAMTGHWAMRPSGLAVKCRKTVQGLARVKLHREELPDKASRLVVLRSRQPGRPFCRSHGRSHPWARNLGTSDVDPKDRSTIFEVCKFRILDQGSLVKSDSLDRHLGFCVALGEAPWPSWVLQDVLTGRCRVSVPQRRLSAERLWRRCDVDNTAGALASVRDLLARGLIGGHFDARQC
jgi:hypothetical protein